MLRLGLCCTFVEQPIRFRSATATATARLERPAALAKIAALVAQNAEALLQALAFCSARGIGCFRVSSDFLPLITHPQLGYRLEELPDSGALLGALERCRRFAQARGLRLSMHPSQFVVLGARDEAVLAASLRELDYHGELCALLGADVITLHGGGAYGDPAAALERLAAALPRLSAAARERLALENDDVTFRPAQLLPLCRRLALPFIYDVHHHRCLPDGLSIAEATAQALATWNREPLFHVSSPLCGWDGPQPRRHHDDIDPADVPVEWHALDLTLEVEAKAKELAVLRLAAELERQGVALRRPRDPE